MYAIEDHIYIYIYVNGEIVYDEIIELITLLFFFVNGYINSFKKELGSRTRTMGKHDLLFDFNSL